MLCQHQDWQDKARDEILQAFRDKEPDFEGLSRVKIVSAPCQISRAYNIAFVFFFQTEIKKKVGKIKSSLQSFKFKLIFNSISIGCSGNNDPQ